MADDPNAIWAKMKPSSFEIQGSPKIIVPIWERVEATHGIRVVPRQVPWVDGEQLDETGLNAKEWATIHPFINDLNESEPGMGSGALYPDRLEAFEKLLEKRKTGTLNLPWRRNIRCKATTWRREAVTDRQDCEILSVSWKEDNENKLENPSSTGSGVRANLASVVEQARFEAERNGIWDGSWEDITTFASQLEAIVAAPGVFLEDVGHKANRVVRAIDSIIATHSKATAGRNVLLDPAGAIVLRLLLQARELATVAEEEARGVPNRVVTWRAPFSGSIWGIAMAPGWEAQEPEELLRLNPAIPDPNWILKGTGIKVLVP